VEPPAPPELPEVPELLGAGELVLFEPLGLGAAVVGVVAVVVAGGVVVVPVGVMGSASGAEYETPFAG
jgi:hypothetical protein